jgi:hypothetical protein
MVHPLHSDRVHLVLVLVVTRAEEGGLSEWAEWAEDLKEAQEGVEGKNGRKKTVMKELDKIGGKVRATSLLDQGRYYSGFSTALLAPLELKDRGFRPHKELLLGRLLDQIRRRALPS